MDIPATVEGIRPYLIHSESYAVVYYSHDDDRETIRSAQLSADALPTDLKVGDAVTVEYLLGIVVAIRRNT